MSTKSFTKRLLEQKYLLAMAIPAIIWILVFQYLPLYGVVVSFQEYDIVKGFFQSEWIGLDNFKELFNDIFFTQSLKITILISLLKLIAGFPAPILFAILLNELKNKKFKSAIQSFTYLPHFLTWVFVVGFTYSFFATDGAINSLISWLGLRDEAILFMGSQGWFTFLIVIQEVWKGFGWGSILYLANMSAIDPQLYESAVMDGAGRFKKAIHITLPMIKPTIFIMLILSISNLIDSNFDQMFLMMNPLVKDTANVLTVYTYNMGILQARYSYAAAIGLFISVISMTLLVSANYLSRKMTGESLY